MTIILSERWTVSELSSVLRIPVGAVRRKVALWQSHGVLREDGPDTLVLVDKGSGSSGQQVVLDHHDEDDMAESAMASAEDQKEEELQVRRKKEKMVLIWGVEVQLGRVT